MLKIATKREVMNSSLYPLGIRQGGKGLNCSSGGLGQAGGKSFQGEGKKPQIDFLGSVQSL